VSLVIICKRPVMKSDKSRHSGRPLQSHESVSVSKGCSEVDKWDNSRIDRELRSDRKRKGVHQRLRAE